MSRQVQIRITAPLRRFTDNQASVAVSADDAGGALRALCDRHPGLRDRLLDSAGLPREFIRVFIGKRSIDALGGGQAVLQDGDVLSIVSPFSGG